MKTAVGKMKAQEANTPWKTIKLNAWHLRSQNATSEGVPPKEKDSLKTKCSSSLTEDKEEPVLTTYAGTMY